MKFYIVDYRLFDGEAEYIEYGLLASRTYETAMKRAGKGTRFFSAMGGWNLAG